MCEVTVPGAHTPQHGQQIGLCRLALALGRGGVAAVGSLTPSERVADCARDLRGGDGRGGAAVDGGEHDGADERGGGARPPVACPGVSISRGALQVRSARRGRPVCWRAGAAGPPEHIDDGHRQSPGAAPRGGQDPSLPAGRRSPRRVSAAGRRQGRPRAPQETVCDPDGHSRLPGAGAHPAGRAAHTDVLPAPGVPGCGVECHLRPRTTAAPGRGARTAPEKLRKSMEIK